MAGNPYHVGTPEWTAWLNQSIQDTFTRTNEQASRVYTNGISIDMSNVGDNAFMIGSADNMTISNGVVTIDHSNQDTTGQIVSGRNNRFTGNYNQAPVTDPYGNTSGGNIIQMETVVKNNKKIETKTIITRDEEGNQIKKILRKETDLSPENEDGFDIVSVEKM